MRLKGAVRRSWGETEGRGNPLPGTVSPISRVSPHPVFCPCLVHTSTALGGPGGLLVLFMAMRN